MINQFFRYTSVIYLAHGSRDIGRKFCKSWFEKACSSSMHSASGLSKFDTHWACGLQGKWLKKDIV